MTGPPLPEQLCDSLSLLHGLDEIGSAQASEAARTPAKSIHSRTDPSGQCLP